MLNPSGGDLADVDVLMEYYPGTPTTVCTNCGVTFSNSTCSCFLSTSCSAVPLTNTTTCVYPPPVSSSSAVSSSATSSIVSSSTGVQTSPSPASYWATQGGHTAIGVISGVSALILLVAACFIYTWAQRRRLATRKADLESANMGIVEGQQSGQPSTETA